ncbi:MAG: hypothetical protein ACK55I_10695, partial [bacterium]
VQGLWRRLHLRARAQALWVQGLPQRDPRDHGLARVACADCILEPAGKWRPRPQYRSASVVLIYAPPRIKPVLSFAPRTVTRRATVIICEALVHKNSHRHFSAAEETRAPYKGVTVGPTAS